MERDFYMSAQDAVTYGVADKILVREEVKDGETT
jgi:ATP-dependent protease ClpP protease subunit